MHLTINLINFKYIKKLYLEFIWDESILGVDDREGGNDGNKSLTHSITINVFNIKLLNSIIINKKFLLS